MRCPMCRSSLLYACGDVISKYFLRPGVKILPEELRTCCPLYSPTIDSHSVPEVGRPLFPYIIENWEIIYNQLRELAAPEVQRRRYLPWNQAHPGAELFYTHDDEDPYAPPNIIPTEGEFHMNIPIVPEGRRDFWVQRPKQHDFHFRAPPEDSFQGGEVFVCTKSLVIVALENEWPAIVEAQIGQLKTRFEAFRRRWPNEIMPVSYTAFGMLTEAFAKLKVKYLVFRRQHEGFIELGPVALRYRDAAEHELQARLDDFWQRFEWIRNEVDEGESRITAQGRDILASHRDGT
ncbi:uncharacterized protein F4817DRAFT_316020 [Daldinia loculata]|uniref:uncharacterized protein n=1 Tax=Daldinia loculata TaxID=103429 RepID=UPI0020C32B52|nr:uncharacterized protein F4817DRAFT_316020 [Daldinia loculata]KAI1647237.1 hypothetical protein F4817DRAFT_316020 [Daldinia loculata]